MTAPTELPWDTPLSELITTIYDLSEELSANPPRLLVQGNRVQLNWQESGAPEPACFSIIDISLSARPHAPASIGIKQPAEASAPSVTALVPETAPAGIDLPLEITGTGFDSGATVNIGDAYGLVPESVTGTSLSVVIKATNIFLPGILEVSVTNGDRQTSNPLPLTLS